MQADKEGEYCGIIIQKPTDHSGQFLNQNDLNKDFVEACINAESIMKEFIYNNVIPIENFPYTRIK